MPSLWYNSGMGHTFALTNKQTAKLINFMDMFTVKAADRGKLPMPMILLLGGVRQALIDLDGLDQPQINVILWALELVFVQMDEDEFDPQLEQIYHKLAGWWPVNPPWYERIKDYNLNGELKK